MFSSSDFWKLNARQDGMGWYAVIYRMEKRVHHMTKHKPLLTNMTKTHNAKNQGQIERSGMTYR